MTRTQERAFHHPATRINCAVGIFFSKEKNGA